MYAVCEREKSMERNGVWGNINVSGLVILLTNFFFCTAVPHKREWAGWLVPFVVQLENLIDKALNRSNCQQSFYRAGLCPF
jgi:hypothetical protein